jgi:TIR domain
MPIKYACFISYRHGQRKLAERIINDLYDALESELETWLDEKVYLDRERLKGGDFYNEALAKALCESVCMIMIFTPTYFSADHTFCTREYKAMEKLEEQRFQALGERVDKRRGLIIPIVFRGEDYLPKEIKDRRLYYNFDKFLNERRRNLSSPRVCTKNS